jgi:holo-[acyl-carrier protein] synthase
VTTAFRVGIDLVSVADVEGSMATFGQRYLDHVFTRAEQRAAAGPDAANRLAARFAAKEAAVKALRLHPDTVAPWTSIEVRTDADGWASLALTGGPAETAARAGLGDFVVSLTHEGGFAAAVVMATTTERSSGTEGRSSVGDRS